MPGATLGSEPGVRKEVPFYRRPWLEGPQGSLGMPQGVPGALGGEVEKAGLYSLALGYMIEKHPTVAHRAYPGNRGSFSVRPQDS